MHHQTGVAASASCWLHCTLLWTFESRIQHRVWMCLFWKGDNAEWETGMPMVLWGAISLRSYRREMPFQSLWVTQGWGIFQLSTGENAEGPGLEERDWGHWGHCILLGKHSPSWEYNLVSYSFGSKWFTSPLYAVLAEWGKILLGSQQHQSEMGSSENIFT